ncbi:stage II sporulation protein E [Orenia metallireducens]|jgi:serine phosphatase RsbU (regulator of sigma subunit)|uniref:Stage II sporulation protein E (SpoIIE) n=1 Tax=Orenia metallireducens TaxID=1413210 RepID=A0A285ID98_9FIRM|nr:SpoIIE family protein phosphatase [Orenia metallireducens]PRX19639.1 stage II sporulation protein E [Orenia metallireducens]SNY45949.1 Stage II sporulation protein E (SpoIIE) [Orenia metallireducens]
MVDQSKNQLKENTLAINQSYELGGDGVIIIAIDSKEIIKINKKALDLLEYKDQQLIGTDISSLGIKGLDKDSQQIESQGTKQKYKFIGEYLQKNGDILYLEVNVQRVDNNYIIYRIHKISEECNYCYQKIKQNYLQKQYQYIHEESNLSNILAHMKDSKSLNDFCQQLLKILLLRTDLKYGFILLKDIFNNKGYIKNETNYKLSNKSYLLIKKLIDNNSPSIKESLNRILDEEFSESSFNYFIEVLEDEGKILGIIVVMDAKENYKEFIQEVLKSFSIFLTDGITKIKILQKEVEKNTLNKEIEIASKIQNSFIPKQTPQHDQLELSIYYNPAKEVGGDYFAFKQKQDKLNIFISDVMGKGIPAAIIVATIHSAFNILNRLEDNPSKILEHINNNLYHDLKNRPTFVSAFYGSFDFKESNFIYSNAAHNQPLLWSNQLQKIITLDKRGILCGIQKDYIYDSYQVKLSHGDILLFYTDGLIDIQNRANNRFTVSRLEQLLIENNQLSAEDIKEKLVEEIYNFSKGTPFPDDISLIICKFLGGDK